MVRSALVLALCSTAALAAACIPPPQPQPAGSYAGGAGTAGGDASGCAAACARLASCQLVTGAAACEQECHASGYGTDVTDPLARGS